MALNSKIKGGSASLEFVVPLFEGIISCEDLINPPYKQPSCQSKSELGLILISNGHFSLQIVSNGRLWESKKN